MVLDSFEHLGKEDKLLFVPIINKLREALQKQALNLYVGCGGQTPKLDINTILHPKPMEQDFIYGDATNVYPITREVPTIELNLGKNANNQVNQYSTIEELKTDSKLLQQSIIISKQINRDLTEEEISLLKIGFTFAQISNIENNKQEFFVENDDNIKSLTDAGVSVKELLAMEPSQQKLFIENSYKVKSLSKARLITKELFNVITGQQESGNTNENDLTQFDNTDHNALKVELIGDATEQA